MKIAALLFCFVSIAFFMIYGVANVLLADWMGALFLLPLAWLFPATIGLAYALDHDRKINLAAKIAIFLFANPVSGILLFCDKEN